MAAIDQPDWQQPVSGAARVALATGVLNVPAVNGVITVGDFALTPQERSVVVLTKLVSVTPNVATNGYVGQYDLYGDVSGVNYATDIGAFNVVGGGLIAYPGIPCYGAVDTSVTLKLTNTGWIDTTTAATIQVWVIALPDDLLKGNPINPDIVDQEPGSVWHVQQGFSPDTPVSLVVSDTNGHQLIPAPPANQYYHVHGLTVGAGAANQEIFLSGQISGIRYLSMNISSTSPMLFVPLDIVTGEALYAQSTNATTIRYTCVYRLVAQGY